MASVSASPLKSSVLQLMDGVERRHQRSRRSRASSGTSSTRPGRSQSLEVMADVARSLSQALGQDADRGGAVETEHGEQPLP